MKAAPQVGTFEIRSKQIEGTRPLRGEQLERGEEWEWVHRKAKRAGKRGRSRRLVHSLFPLIRNIARADVSLVCQDWGTARVASDDRHGRNGENSRERLFDAQQGPFESTALGVMVARTSARGEDRTRGLVPADRPRPSPRSRCRRTG